MDSTLRCIGGSICSEESVVMSILVAVATKTNCLLRFCSILLVVKIRYKFFLVSKAINAEVDWQFFQGLQLK